MSSLQLKAINHPQLITTFQVISVGGGDEG